MEFYRGMINVYIIFSEPSQRMNKEFSKNNEKVYNKLNFEVV